LNGNVDYPALGVIGQNPSLTSYLDAYFVPLQAWLNQDDVTEILINRPGEVWIERSGPGKMERFPAPQIDNRLIERLATQIARVNNQGVNRENPLLSAILEDGARVQVIAPSATRGDWVIAIRRHKIKAMPLSAFAAHVKPGDEPAIKLARSDPFAFLQEAIAARKTILISGGTSTGKTSFLNALLAEVPESERIVLVEDTPEIRLSHPNSVGLVAMKGDMGEARVNTNDLLQAALRLRPDRIVLGELRGSESVSFLRAINTGHPGSFSTIHANSPRGAIEQLALMVMQAGIGLSRQDVIEYAKFVVDIVVQLERQDGKRGIGEIVITRELAW
jgi:type IV secretion system protein VirB11